MRIGNDHNGNMDGTIISISNVEIDLVVKALNFTKDEPMCANHADILDKLTLQFEAMLRELPKIS